MLVGCATTANNTQNKLNTYIGSNIDDFLIKVTPRKITNLSSGGKKYDFKTLEVKLPYPIVCEYALITNNRGTVTQVTKPRCY